MLADALFFASLVERTGRFRLSPRVLGLGLSAGLLGELVLEQRVRVANDGRVFVVDRRPPAEDLARHVLYLLAGEAPTHPVRSWLSFLAQEAALRVGRRLWRAGQVYPHLERRWWRRETRWEPADINRSGLPVASLSHALQRRRRLDAAEALLAGLVWAVGLEPHVLFTASPPGPARDYLRHVVAHLPPAEHALISHLHATVGDAVLTGRT